VVFDDLIVEEPGTNYDIVVDCTSSETNETISAMTIPFHVHDYPEVGMLRQTVTTFGFKGPLKRVAKILSAFEGSMGTATCKGCPPGTVARSGPVADDDVDVGSYNECWSPIEDQDQC
jgi:hypothetical protein